MSGAVVVRAGEGESVAWGPSGRVRVVAAAETTEGMFSIVESFGLQVLDLPAGFADYPEHDHAHDGQEEVYVILAGAAELVVAGERIQAEAGTLIRVGPAAKRRLEPGPNGVQLLAIGCAPGGYERPDAFKVVAQT